MSKMKELKEQIDRVEKQIDNVENAWVDELAEISNTKGFDIYSADGDARINKLAKKYSGIIDTLTNEYEQLRKQHDDLALAEQRKRFKSVYEHELQQEEQKILDAAKKVRQSTAKSTSKLVRKTLKKSHK